MEDLENCSKRNNVVVWVVKEGCEKDFTSMEEFIEKQLFVNHMKLEEGIEVMRAHRTRVKRNPSTTDTPKPRPLIHVCLLRYTRSECCGQTQEQQVQGTSNIFISDVSKSVRMERAKLRKNHLPNIKGRENVLYAFIL